MKRTFLKISQRIAAAAAPLSTGAAFAHDGHGLGGPHWHASDTWGFACVALLAALALWSSRDE